MMISNVYKKEVLNFNREIFKFTILSYEQYVMTSSQESNIQVEGQKQKEDEVIYPITDTIKKNQKGRILDKSSTEERAADTVFENKQNIVKLEIVDQPQKVYLIQFFTSKYSDKTFPSLNGLGQIVSKLNDQGNTVYFLKAYNQTLQSEVKKLGFKDAFIVK